MDKALIVALNRCDLGSIPRLRGTHTDANQDAERLVQVYGFKPENVRLVFDDRATTDEILSRLDWLACDNAPTDRILFSFSGHGARQTFRNAAGGISGTHEGIVPYDFTWDDVTRCILDTEIAKRFGDPDFLGEKIVFLDCCHSGGMDRSLIRRVTRRTRTARGIEAPEDLAWRSTAVAAPLAANASIANPTGFALLGACTATQTAADCYQDGAWRGAFHGAFWAIMSDGGQRAPLSVVRESVNKRLMKDGFPQDPRFVGTHLGQPMWGGGR